ncbi:armadillo-type protein, partial [Mycena sp. CBHHK59/15]
LINFLGELFKLEIITQRIMHECVMALLTDSRTLDTTVYAEDIEGICLLMSNFGQLLDVAAAQGHMDIYFFVMNNLTRRPGVSRHLQFMSRHVIELRDRQW